MCCNAMTELGLQLNLEYNKLHYHCSAIGLPLHCHCISIAQALDNHCTVGLGLQLKLERRQIRSICQQASLGLFWPTLHRTLHVVLTSQFHCELYNILCMLVWTRKDFLKRLLPLGVSAPDCTSIYHTSHPACCTDITISLCRHLWIILWDLGSSFPHLQHLAPCTMLAKLDICVNLTEIFGPN